MGGPNTHSDIRWPPGVAALTLFTYDLGASKDFYVRVFGIESLFEDSDSVVFRFGEVLVNLLRADAAPELIEPGEVAAPGAGHQAVFTLEVDDVDERVNALRDQGVPLLNGPVDRPWGPRTASFCDPSGHIWEIAHND